MINRKENCILFTLSPHNCGHFDLLWPKFMQIWTWNGERNRKWRHNTKYQIGFESFWRWRQRWFWGNAGKNGDLLSWYSIPNSYATQTLKYMKNSALFAINFIGVINSFQQSNGSIKTSNLVGCSVNSVNELLW